MSLFVRGLSDGAPGQTPLVLLHGFTGDTTTWEPFVRGWPAESATPLLAVDLPGHGRSPALALYSVPGAAELVLAAHGGPLHLLGYSMGARVALRAAIMAPERVRSLALVGVSPGITDADARAERVVADEALARRLETEPFEQWVDDWLAEPLFATQRALPPDVRAACRAQRLANRPEELAKVLRGMGTGAMTPLWEELPRLAVPTLLVAGELDLKFTALAREMARLIPRAEVAIVPGVGHAVQLEEPRALATVVADFLAGVR